MERRRPRQSPARPLVLIVDSHDDARELNAVALASFGFETETVDDPAHAYARAWATHPDIIAAEVSFPQLDGWVFIQDLKRNPRTRDIPVVVVTSHGETPVRERAEREGCAAFLMKPCLPRDLAMTLRSVLGHTPTHDHISACH
jgi:CheY-like chemotaxis protein